MITNRIYKMLFLSTVSLIIICHNIGGAQLASASSVASNNQNNKMSVNTLQMAYSNKKNDKHHQDSHDGTLTKGEIINSLNLLIQQDIDIVHSYNQAIDAVKSPEIRSHFTDSRYFHERNIDKLSEIVNSYGGEAPTYSKDFKGFMMQGYTMIRGMMGDVSVMKAMLTNLNIAQRAYHDALKLNFPSDIRNTVNKSSDAINKDVHYLEEKIKQLSGR